MDAPYAVIDTCVLYQDPIYSTLLYVARNGFFHPVWTDEIMRELRKNLGARIGEEKVDRRIAAMEGAFPEANLDRVGIAYRHRSDEMPNDPKDRHVLAAAVASEAELVITHNLKDFRLDGTDYEDEVGVLTPDEFLLELADSSELDQLNMLATLYRQVGDMRSVATLEPLLAKLERSSRCVAFVARVRELNDLLPAYPSGIIQHICAGTLVPPDLLEAHQRWRAINPSLRDSVPRAGGRASGSR